MEFTEQFNFKRPIHHAVFSSPFFAGVDNSTSLIFFDRAKGKLSAVQKFNSPIPHPHHRATGSSINGRLLVLYFAQHKATYLLAFNSKKGKYLVVKKLFWSSEELECTEFDNQNHLFATGDNNGKVFVYNCKNGRLYATLPRRSDYIATMAFNRDGNLLAYSSYDKSLTIYDLHRNKVLYCGTGQMDGVIISIRFLHEKNRIVLGDRNGKVTLYDFLKKKTIRTLLFCPAWPMSMYVEENDKYLLVGDKKGNLHMADLENETAEKRIIHTSPYCILDIKLFGKMLYFIFENGEMKGVDTHAAQAKLEEAFSEENYRQCYALIENDPLLGFSATKEKLDARFEELLKESLGLIITGKLDEAKQMLKPFEADSKHYTKIQTNVKFAKKIYEFAQMINRGDLDMAYRVAASDEKYRELTIYEKLEADFSDAFDKAGYLLTAKIPDRIGANKMLAPYANVSAKAALIKKLFDQPTLFNKARLLYKQKEYGILGKLFEKYPLLKEAPVYREYADYASNLEFFFELHMEMQEFNEALEIALVVEKHFPKINARLKEEISRLKVTLSFMKAISEKSFLVALGLVSRNEFLIELPEYRKLDRFLNNRFEEAMAYGRAGEFEPMHKMLQGFLKNKNLQPRAIAIYKLYYIDQLVNDKLALDDAAWERGIHNYVGCFGKDDEIEQIARDAGKSDLLKQIDKGEYEAFSAECIKKVIYEDGE